MGYKEELAKIRQRDIACWKYHAEHPESKLCNARDRRAGYNSRQAVYAAIARIQLLIDAGEIVVALTRRKRVVYDTDAGEKDKGGRPGNPDALGKENEEMKG